MATGVYDYNAPTLEVLPGMLMQSENVLEIGLSALWGSLDTTSPPYLTYGASIGLESGQGRQLGACDDVSFESNKTIEAVEIGNVLDSGLFTITDETNQVTYAMREWRPENIALAFGTTWNAYGDGTNGIIMFGGGCNIISRPMVVRGTNISCSAPAITSLTDGVLYWTLTLYDCYSSEGGALPIQATVGDGIEITMVAKPVLSLTVGERSGNLYLAAV